MGKHEGRQKKPKIVEEILKENTEFEAEKEEKLLNLLVEIIVQTTLKEFYETCDQIPPL